MSEVLLSAGLAFASGLLGVFIGSRLAGRPPAPRSAWEDLAKAKREALEREAKKGP